MLMYNDEMPNGTSSEAAAHAKGVVAFDAESGFWMTHSVPRYPPAPDDGYSYPTTGTRYGQTVLCVSLHFKQADLIGKHCMAIFRLKGSAALHVCCPERERQMQILLARPSGAPFERALGWVRRTL